MKKQRLSKQDLENTLKKMRQWEKEKLDLVALLVWDRNWYEYEVNRLSVENAALKGVDMFEGAKILPPPPNTDPLEERAYKLLKSKKTDAWNMFVSAKRLTHQEAINLAERHAAKIGDKI